MGSSLRDLLAFVLYEGRSGEGNIESDITRWEIEFANSEHCCNIGCAPEYCPRCEVDCYYKLADNILVAWKG